MPDKCNYRLEAYTRKYSQEAFNLIVDWANLCNGDLEGAFKATTRLINLCRIVIAPSGVVAAVIYPDYDRYDEHVLIVHSVLSDAGVKAKDAQIAMFSAYIGEIFAMEYSKVVLEFPAVSRLNARMAKAVGMQLEGTHRKEWTIGERTYDILRFGILKDEWEALNGQ